MTSGVYERTPEMNAANSKSKMGHEVSDKTCAAISEGLKNSDAVKANADKMHGVPLSPEHCAALSVSRINSDAVKVVTDRQRGGNDIVKHHHIYDHDDLSKYTIEMTRREHSRIHRFMEALGLEIPHINTGHENAEELKLMEYIKKVELPPKGL